MGSFETKAEDIADRQNLPADRARAILAAGARNASPAAKRKNPALKKVKGPKLPPANSRMKAIDSMLNDQTGPPQRRFGG